jgi:Protein of unknown function (DUF4238)
VISQVLLKEWVQSVPVKPGAGRRLIRHDLATGCAESRTTGQVGYEPDFVKIDSQAVEAVWQRVERRLRAAIRAGEAGTLLGNPEFVSVMRDAIALHFARNPQALAVHLASFAAAHAHQREALAETATAVEAFRRQYGGILPAGPDGRRLGADAVLARFTEAVDSGAVFRLDVEARFDTVCDLFQHAGLEVLAPDQADDEFVIGDVPALTVNSRTGAAGVLNGVTLGDADAVMLPLGPRLLAALGPRDQVGRAPRKMVDRINELQVKAAHAYVCYRPGACVAGQIASWRAPHGASPAASD